MATGLIVGPGVPPGGSEGGVLKRVAPCGRNRVAGTAEAYNSYRHCIDNLICNPTAKTIRTISSTLRVILRPTIHMSFAMQRINTASRVVTQRRTATFRLRATEEKNSPTTTNSAPPAAQGTPVPGTQVPAAAE